MANYRVKHVVVDSGGFIKNAPLKDLGLHVYSIPEVVDEIRDKATRQRLQVLPYELHLKQPSAEAIRLVTEFSKKTGDYRSLSAVDIKLMALVYQLEKEHCGTEHLHTEPKTQVTWTTTRQHLEKPTEIAGFYLKKKTNPQQASSNDTAEGSSEVTSQSTSEEPVDDPAPLQSNPDSTSSEETQNQVQIDIVSSNQDTPEDIPDRVVGCREGETLHADCMEEGSESEEEESEEEEEEEEDGWITPSNIAAVKKKMGVVDTEEAPVEVGCLTLDFSMQNVLIQIGLNVVSIDGMLIKRAKSYVQRCSACMKISTNMEKSFCPTCGNATLQRVAMTVNDQGQIQYFLSRRRPINLRGLKHSLPAPQGGKYGTNPLLCEDQPQAHQRLSKKAKVKYNVFEAGYEAHTSPFAPKDTHSRSAQLHFGGNKKRRNPNENKKVYGRRK